MRFESFSLIDAVLCDEAAVEETLSLCGRSNDSYLEIVLLLRVSIGYILGNVIFVTLPNTTKQVFAANEIMWLPTHTCVQNFK